MIQKLINWKSIAVFTLVILIGLFILQVVKTPEHVLEDISVEEQRDMLVLHIRTRIPLRYENHFPEGPSDFVQIKVRAVSFSGADGSDFLDSSTILPGFLELIPVSNIAYEGNVAGGPFISIRFTRPVNYQVKEDPELNGIQLYVPKNQ